MKKKSIWVAWLLALTMCLFGITACGDAGATDEEENATVVTDPVKVTCENGVMLGQTIDGVTSFKGVPYAKPPVDDLRWKAPEAPDPSDEEIECYDFGYTALNTSGRQSRRPHSRRMKTA